MLKFLTAISLTLSSIYFWKKLQEGKSQIATTGKVANTDMPMETEDPQVYEWIKTYGNEKLNMHVRDFQKYYEKAKGVKLSAAKALDFIQRN